VTARKHFKGKKPRSFSALVYICVDINLYGAHYLNHMSGYTKLFNSILASTIWRADDKTRLVWITLLAMADKRGYVESSVPGLADFARVSLADCQRSLAELQAPDEFSRTKESEGRRIEAIDGGWKLINHGKYREKMGADERREYLKLKQREYRDKHRQQPSTNVNKVSDTDTLLTHASPTPEADTEAAPDPVPVTKNKLDRRIAPVTTSTNGARHSFGPSIIGRNTHLTHAACDARFSYCVPDAVHRKLADLLAPKHDGDRDTAKDALQKWYPTIWAVIPDGTVMGDAFRFWQAHFDTAFASPRPKKVSKLSAAIANIQREARLAKGHP
jgi:hypothetical protein